MKGDLIEFLFFGIIIAITVIGRIVKAQAEKTKDSSDDEWNVSAPKDDGWKTWQPEAVKTSTQQWPKTTMSPAEKLSKHQLELIESERQKAEQERQIQAKPTPVVVPTPGSPSYYETETNAYEFTQPETTPYHASSANFSENSPSEQVDIDNDAMRDMRDAVVPTTKHMTRKGTGKDRVIQISINGRKDLRRAILLNEILGQPRAFDL